MKHVIALDVIKGKSSMVIYDDYCQCEFEGELHHTRVFRFPQARLQLPRKAKARFPAGSSARAIPAGVYIC
ncbi:hypothetical protein [Siminovitchia sp. FSL W7-1587]|uniref:hypothetical protein n=1 Tax=Siminovitchia sp. FSL W7-1587 TaxID=2954699 RepID=UPI0030D51959